MIGNITFTLHVYYLDLMSRTEGVLTAKQKGCLASDRSSRQSLNICKR